MKYRDRSLTTCEYDKVLVILQQLCPETGERQEDFCMARQTVTKIGQTINLPTTKFKHGTTSLTGDDFMIKVWTIL
jgi:hypothetical protein